MVSVWESSGQKKITLKVSSEDELVKLAKLAETHQLCSYTVHDAGHTQVAPNTRTVLAIGPAPESYIDPLTEHLKIL
jgi:peptidyl-tRNA hydrolase